MMDIREILKYLPHRYPFLMVDRILEMEPGTRIVGIKNVTYNEPFFQGHFPGKPVMPGVLICEAMAQVGAILAHSSSMLTGVLLEDGRGGDCRRQIGCPWRTVSHGSLP